MLPKDKVKSKKSQNFKKRKYNIKMHYPRFLNKYLNPSTKLFMITASKNCTIHLQHLRRLKKKIKKLKRVGIFEDNKPLIWIIFNFNRIFSKKSSNSRMGKGRGNVHSWVIDLKKFSVLIKLIYVSFNSAKGLSLKLKEITHFDFIVF